MWRISDMWRILHFLLYAQYLIGYTVTDSYKGRGNNNDCTIGQGSVL